MKHSVKNALATSSLHGDVVGPRPGQVRQDTIRSRNRRAFVLFAGPALLWFMLWMLWPLLNMFYVSTLDWRGLLRPASFAGLDNYVRLFGDERFYIAWRNTGLHLAMMIAVVLPVSFTLGFLLSQRLAGYRVLRTIFFSPAMLSAPALAMLFMGVYLPDGIINYLLRLVGLSSLTHVWLANSSTAIWAVIIVDMWAATGLYAVLFSAALANVPKELYEAAYLDGAGLWTIMWRVAFPLVMDFFGVVLMLIFIWTISQAHIVLLLTQGGPGSASLTVGYMLYELAFVVQRLGYSQALGVLLMVLGLLGALAIRRMTSRTYEN